MIRLDEQRLRAVLRDLRLSTGEVLRSLSTLRLGDLSDELKDDLLAEAIRHAGLLEGGIGSLLDLAELGTADLALDLQEVDLFRLLRHRLAVAQSSLVADGITVARLQEDRGAKPLNPLIADPAQVARMIDLALQVSATWSRAQTSISVISAHSRFATSFVLDGEIGDWHETWWKGTVSLQATEPDDLLDSLRVPQRAFRRDAVRRLQLIHLIAERHGGSFEHRVEDGSARIQVELPLIAPAEALIIALESRLRRAPAGIAHLAVVRLRVPETTELETYGRRLQTALLRASDALFPFPEDNDLVLVVNDCTAQEVPHFLGRVVDWAGKPTAVGSACCPAEGKDAQELLRQAKSRLELSLAEQHSA